MTNKPPHTHSLDSPINSSMKNKLFEQNSTKEIQPNTFSKNIPPINQIIKNETVEKATSKMLNNVLIHLGISPENSARIIRDCMNVAKNSSDLNAYEKRTHEILEKEGVIDQIPQKLTKRAEMIYDQIKDYIVGNSTIDLGCGDGKVGQLLSENGQKVLLCDIYQHPHINNLDLEFKKFQAKNPVPYKDNSTDNTLALTVFHHCDDPVRILKESHRITKPGGKVHVIESVYGVSGHELHPDEQEKAKHYLSLSSEKQRLVNIFFDHFYNRIIHFSEDPKTKVNVPFNFNTPEGWKELFEKNGFVQEKIIHLGNDQPTVPEYHTLHILRVVK